MTLPPPFSRRERRRAATVAEIVATARQLLVEGGLSAVSLREVARRMGMTGPALYRYVDGRHDLVDRLEAETGRELAEIVRQAVSGSDLGTCPAEAVPAAARSLRNWARAHPAEFGLLFACGPRGPRPHSPRPDTPRPGPGQPVGPGPSFADRLLTAVGVATVTSCDPASPGSGSVPPDVADACLRSWVRLLGAIAVEAFGHHVRAGVSGEQLFEAELTDVINGLHAGPRTSPGT